MKLLKFYADWCAPCKMLTPMLTEMIKDKDGLNLEEVNIEDTAGRELATQYGVRSIPALILLAEDNTVVREFRGYDTKPEYRRKLEEFVTI